MSKKDEYAYHENLNVQNSSFNFPTKALVRKKVLIFISPSFSQNRVIESGRLSKSGADCHGVGQTVSVWGWGTVIELGRLTESGGGGLS